MKYTHTHHTNSFLKASCTVALVLLHTVSEKSNVVMTFSIVSLDCEQWHSVGLMIQPWMITGSSTSACVVSQSCARHDQSKGPFCRYIGERTSASAELITPNENLSE
jgi:hypothetical protein